MKSTMSASFTLTVVGFNSIATPARRTTTSRRVLLATCCLRSCQQSGSNSGSNPPCIDQEPLCCCCWAFRPSLPSSWAVSPSKHLRFKRQLPGVRSSRPAVRTPLSSPSQTLGPIRPVLTESRHAAVRLLDLLRRLRGLQVHRSTSASNDNLQACDPRCQLFALM